MSSMNAVKSRMSGIIGMLAPYAGTIKLGLYVIVAAIVVYSVYTVLFPPPDMFQQVLLNATTSASDLNGVNVPIVPPMGTGGDYSLEFWMFIQNWDYKAGQVKHVFSIASDGKPAGGRPPHVSILGMLYPNENKMMIRVNQDAAAMGANSASSSPDFTVMNNITALYKGTMSPGAFQTTTDYPICDIQDLDLQKWIHVAIVVSGRVIDVYVDGKLARSCVTPGVPIVEIGKNSITFADNNGFGGAMSTTRFYGYALTPAAVYGSYQDGPDTGGIAGKYGFVGWLAQTLGLNVSMTGGSNPTAPAANITPTTSTPSTSK